MDNFETEIKVQKKPKCEVINNNYYSVFKIVLNVFSRLFCCKDNKKNEKQDEYEKMSIERIYDDKNKFEEFKTRNKK
jgi:hypothetical protein